MPVLSSRRQFLKRAVLLTTAGSVAIGLGTLATRQPAIPFPEIAADGDPNPMNKKTLVTYVTRAGSTAEVAQAIAKTLSAQGAAVEVLPLHKVTGLKNYRAVVLGSAIRMGQWLPDAVKFVEQNQAQLCQMPTAFFAVHLMNTSNAEASRTARLAYLDPVRKRVTPQKEAFFAGVGDWKKVSFLDGLIGKAVQAPEGDFRDWEAIRAWAVELRGSGFVEGLGA